MKKNIDRTEVYLQPGDFYFGDKSARISTLLGSCVAITLWHPKKQIGGMCHYMLPSNLMKKNIDKLNGKYAEDAMEMFINEIGAAYTIPSEYQVKVFGGGQMFSETVELASCLHNNMEYLKTPPCQNVACKNVFVARYLLKEYGFKVVSHDLGGREHRKVIFDVASGDVWLRRGN